MKYNFFWRLAFIFLLIFSCSFSFPFGILPDIGAIGSIFFTWQAKIAAEYILGWQSGTYIELLISDSALFYLNALLILLISCLLAFFLRWSSPRSWFVFFARYYLVIQLLTYGFSKIFKVQFYLPEPNTLYTNLGEISQDLLFWTMMGASRAYTIFGGIMEILAAVGLLFHRTRLLGALLATAVFVQIFAINICFNISVKLLSGYLLLLSLLILVADARKLFAFFFEIERKQNEIAVQPYQYAEYLQKSYYKTYILIKIIVILFLFANAIYPYWLSGNYNDDTKVRPPLHGAYTVSKFVANGDTLTNFDGNSQRWAQVFVHRRDYFIIELGDAKRLTYELVTDTTEQYLALQNEEQKVNETYIFFDYELSDSLIYLSGEWAEQRIWVELSRLPYRHLPILQPEFAWTIDNYRANK